MISNNPAIQSAMTQGLIGAPQVKAPAAGSGKDGDFGKQLLDALKEVNDAQNHATDMQNDMITGHKHVEVQDVMIAMEKAGTAMQFTMAVRNKMLDAYQEIERLQV